MFLTRRIAKADSAATKITQAPAPIQNHRHPSGIVGPRINLRIPSQPPINSIQGAGCRRVIINTANPSMRCGALTGPLPKAAMTARSQCVRNIVAALPAKKPADMQAYERKTLFMLYNPGPIQIDPELPLRSDGYRTCRMSLTWPSDSSARPSSRRTWGIPPGARSKSRRSGSSVWYGTEGIGTQGQGRRTGTALTPATRHCVGLESAQSDATLAPAQR